MLNRLPPEVSILILESLSPEQIIEIAKTNTELNHLAKDNSLWKKKFEKHFQHRVNGLSSQSDIDWYAEFGKAYQDEYKRLSANTRKLFSLVKEGDIEGLNTLKSSDLSQCDQNGVTLLKWAQKMNDQAMLDYFYSFVIKEHSKSVAIDTAAVDSMKRRVLHWAILCRQPVETVNLLIRQGATIDATPEGRNALHRAAEEGQAEIAELLITQFHADINYLSDYGATALFFAVEHGREKVVDVLLKHHANTSLSLRHTYSNYHNRFNVKVGDTPLHAAIRSGRLDIVKALLINEANINTRNALGYNALRLAAALGHAEIAELLITKFHAGINSLGVYGETALLSAVERGREKVVDVLLKHHADTSLSLHTLNPYLNVRVGDTPLHVAIKSGRRGIVERLLNKGADINTLAEGHNALSLAAAEGHAEIVELLIRFNADINFRGGCGATPLIFAAEHGHQNVIDVLLKHHADISLPLHTRSAYHDKFNMKVGDTAYHAVIKSGRKGFASELKLIHYSKNVNLRADEHYKTSFTLFGHTFNFGCSAKQKKAAVKALTLVHFNGADKSTLDVHQEALNNGELGAIYNDLRINSHS